LSFFERMERSITPELVALLPPKARPSFKYQDDSSVDNAETLIPLSQELIGKIRAKESAEALDTLLQAVSSERLDLLVQCILQTGSKSVSHLLSVLERYCSLLRRYSTTLEEQEFVLNAVGSYWVYSNLHQVILLDKLMTYRIVTNLAIIQWLFSPTRVEFLKLYVTARLTIV
jgi:nuclear cap-binding protein subunit 1